MWWVSGGQGWGVQDKTGGFQGAGSCQHVWTLSWRGQELRLAPGPMPTAGSCLGTRKALLCLEHWPWPYKTPLDALITGFRCRAIYMVNAPFVLSSQTSQPTFPRPH